MNPQFREPEPTRTLPEPELAPDVWTAEEDWGHDLSPFKRTTLAYVFHFGFHTGVRAPSEIAALDLDDVDRDAGEIVVTEKKKGGNRRRMPLPSYVLDAPNSKSLGNYIDHHRDQADADKDAVFVKLDGKRWTDHYLQTELSRVGKRVWPGFHPYKMRRYVATEFLIATEFNVYKVAQALGDEVRTVEKHYLDRARARAEMDTEHVPRLRGGGVR
ncbi:hypothetical protein BRD56_00885 [Thermoplasmatales archaeon SW_10_69_26]|nr:MAG: hypothetical protein BRD56_00885 [Thermoplasmatales archaeon SW_10_69_26]